MSIHAKRQPHWYDDHRELVQFASVLEEAGAFSNAREAIYFFEKPWKWANEWQVWVNLGRPVEVAMEDLAPSEA